MKVFLKSIHFTLQNVGNKGKLYIGFVWSDSNVMLMQRQNWLGTVLLFYTLIELTPDEHKMMNVFFLVSPFMQSW